MDDLNAVQRFQRDMDTFVHLHYLKSCCWWKLGWKSIATMKMLNVPVKEVALIL